MLCRRSRSGPLGVLRTVVSSCWRERCASFTKCRHGSLTVNGSIAGILGARGIASATDTR